MKTLILSCNNGGGHNAAASALQETFRAHGGICDMADALAFLSPRVSSAVSRFHTLAYRRAPDLMRRGYEQSEHLRLTEDSLLYRVLAAGTRRLAAYIRAGDYDTVLCTHVFAGMMLAACRCDENVHTAIVETDYTVSPGSACCFLDRHFVPDACFVPRLAAQGVPMERIVASGIPVHQRFYAAVPPEEARVRLDLPPRHRHLVLMCGSMGGGPMEELTAALVPELPPRQELTVVCGSRASLRHALEKRYAPDPRVHITGRTEEVSLLLDSADVLLTKPGGITTSEAAVKGVPMVLLDTVGGCESHNARYFVRRGLACCAADPAEAVRLCVRLLAAPPVRREPDKRPAATEIIYGVMSQLGV